MQAPPEQLGSFYLGAEYDLAAGAQTGTVLNYDARDLVTHAVCVGMTGSGKTGLCVGLLEEAGLDKVPALLIDPKGDITNLLLQFPDLHPEDFQPWINADDAARKGKSVEEYAQATAETWSKGLADWGITGQRIRDLQATVDYTIFTPGSEMGVPINIMGSLAAPGLDWSREAEAIRERISGTVAALLGLAGISADPVRSREGILLANIFEYFWQQNEDLDLAKLIQSIQNPPVKQLGVFEVDTFYPAKDRFELAMAFNTLLASPKFQVWLQGEPLDVDRLFFTAEGKPRHSVIYIAHLSDGERMFIVTLLLENLVTWMRRQSGTTSLRALLYFDEVFGYFPPTAEPSSKRPLLTLLKQARAFGLGVVLVTQNPVDIDYKGLTNAGTWFIGKLQAERDKERVLAGLKGALSEAGQSVATDYDRLITQLGSRVFLMHNVHEDRPVVFHTRWAMSYLRGPLTLPQVRTLTTARGIATTPAPPAGVAPVPAESVAAAAPAPATAPAESIQAAPAAAPAPPGLVATPPVLAPDVEQIYLPLAVDDGTAVRLAGSRAGAQVNVKAIQLCYDVGLLGFGTVRFVDSKRDIDTQQDLLLLASEPGTLKGFDWGAAEELRLRQRDLGRQPAAPAAGEGPYFASPPEGMSSASDLRAAAKDLTDWLYYNQRLSLEAHPELGVVRRPDESERDFKIRLQQAARERRDDEVEELRKKYETKLKQLADKREREERELAQDQAKAQSKQAQQWINIGESVLGMFMGRRSMRSISSAASKWDQSSRAQMDVEESKAAIAKLSEEIQALETELQAQIDEITRRWDQVEDALTEDELKPRRTDVNVHSVALAWVPLWQVRYDDGIQERVQKIPAYLLPEVG
ncbi:MAG: hypothetical protein H3C34_03070 [Caldilineaceae bacterium]|nr:hypothetical protein [Caldilineaceae bacterium]